MKWCEAKYQPSTIDNHRIAIFTFFQWFQERYPELDRLDGISRDIALSYGQYLQEQAEAGRYGNHYRHNLHSRIRFFFDFLVEERFATSPMQNPFSLRDLPQKADMLPRYLTDQELRTVLSYCEALGYQRLLGHTSGTVNIGQGIEAWASFVISQGHFAMATATRQAIAFCEALGVEVPDLSGEVQRLVSAMLR